MKHKFQKNMRIVSGLLFFCNHAGAVEYEIKITPRPASTYFEIHATAENMDAEDLKTLQDALKLPRAHEVEQNFWELGGDADTSNELTLIGMMLDSSAAEYKNGVLTIRAERVD